jgi:hypothetical protein
MKTRIYLSLVIFAFLGLAGWTAHAQLQRDSRTRQVWEYKSLVLVQTVGVGAQLAFYEGSKTIPGTPVSRIPELGAEGWELVSVTATLSPSRTNAAETSTYVYWLKRPK